jgi:hypothetical protein
MLAGGLAALVCTAGHDFPGAAMFYRPIKGAIADQLQAGVFTGIWHLITFNFTLSAIALIVAGIYSLSNSILWSVAVQFAGCAAVYPAISLRLGGILPLFQWLPFAFTGILAAIGAQMAH